MKVYISGQITGLSKDVAFAKFEQAEADLLGSFYNNGQFGILSLVNPMKKVTESENKQWLDYMREDIKLLSDCDAIYLISNWRNSKGARLEHYIALGLGLVIIDQL